MLNPPLAVLTYSNSERPYDIGLLIFSSLAFVIFVFMAVRRRRDGIRAKQAKRARFALIPLGLFIILLITGMLHLRP